MNIICNNYTCSILYKIISNSIDLSTRTFYYITDKSTIYTSIKRLAELDIMFNLELIKQVCSDIQDQEKIQDNTSIKLAMYKIQETIELLNKELNYIYENIKDHENKYFHNWRALDISTNIELVEKLNTVLLHRYNILIDLLKIYYRRY